jgi:carbamoylphosphate synthase small subunit
VDTRAITRRLRTVGVMMGTITCDETAEEALKRLKSMPCPYVNPPLAKRPESRCLPCLKCF